MFAHPSLPCAIAGFLCSLSLLAEKEHFSRVTLTLELDLLQVKMNHRARLDVIQLKNYHPQTHGTDKLLYVTTTKSCL